MKVVLYAFKIIECSSTLKKLVIKTYNFKNLKKETILQHNSKKQLKSFYSLAKTFSVYEKQQLKTFYQHPNIRNS